MKLTKYTQDEILNATLEYFNGDALAANIWMQKYALKDADGNIYEKTPDDMHRRIAKEFARIEAKYPNPMTEEDIYQLLRNFKYIVPQGSPMAGIGNTFQILSISNCFVTGELYDSYGGILWTDQQLAQLYKRRCGVGTDISHIRPCSTKVTNAALTTTGILPFMERYSNTTREVAMEGRRGALLLSYDVQGMDAVEFINAKIDRTKVTGANISLKVSDAFLNAVVADDKYIQQFPINVKNPKYKKEIQARDLWQNIVRNAWAHAEPGLLMWDTIKRESIGDCYTDQGFNVVSTNPCIIGGTLIATADGRNAVSIKELAKEGKDVPLYSTNQTTGKTEIKWGRNPRKTGIKKEVWKLTLDDGSFLIATPNHKVLLSNLEYTELNALNKGDSIVPFYSFDSNGYRQISRTGEKMFGGNFRNRRQYRLINEFINGEVDAVNFAIHHKDFNKQNDRVDNLLVMPMNEHKKLHSDRMLGDKNPYHQFSDEQKHLFAFHTGFTNGRSINVTNEELIEEGRKAYKELGKLTYNNWIDYAKKHHLPQFLGNNFRFKTFANFKHQVVENHKVESVEFYGYEDVYNITVDDNHNYHVITKTEDDNYIVSSGICVKNCGEIVLCTNDSCRLLLINLFNYIIDPFTPNARFARDLFIRHAQTAERFMDDIVDLELEKIDQILSKVASDPEPEHIKMAETMLWTEIKKKAINGRRTGLGITGLGDMIAAMNLQYGTSEATQFATDVLRELGLASYHSSVTLAEERGAFPIYSWDKEKGNPFLERLFKADPKLKERMKKFGRRGISLNTISPAGSVSVLLGVSSGVEPVFSLRYKRRRKVNPMDKNVKIVFTDQSGDQWEEYEVIHPPFAAWLTANGYDVAQVALLPTDAFNAIAAKSPYNKASANDIDWREKVKMQGALQKWIDHSISNTTNMPNTATEEDIHELYLTAWREGCKGVTVYRDGSRTGVLVASDSEDKIKKDETFGETHAKKRPKFVDCDVIKFMNNSEKWIGFLGSLDGHPYEIFTGLADEFPVPVYVEKGRVRRVKDNGNGSRYDFLYTDKGGFEQEVKGLNRVFNKEYWNYAKFVSGLLRHRMPIVHLIHLLESLNMDDMINTWINGVIRILKKYIKDGTADPKAGACPECGATLQYSEGCLKCPSCQYSKCG
jgi:ribonucleotide reductase alpha subunit